MALRLSGGDSQRAIAGLRVSSSRRAELKAYCETLRNDARPSFVPEPQEEALKRIHERSVERSARFAAQRDLRQQAGRAGGLAAGRNKRLRAVGIDPAAPLPVLASLFTERLGGGGEGTAGDAVLQALADCLSERLRAVARVAGEWANHGKEEKQP